MKLYHYTTIDTFLKIWVSNQLRFSQHNNTNDPFERRKAYNLPINTPHFSYFVEKANEFDKIYSRIFESYKQISFTKSYSSNLRQANGYTSPMMWGHYAHNENGVCIEIDKEKLPQIPNEVKMRSVIYKEEVPLLPYDILRMDICEKSINQLIANNSKDLFFTKHKHWKFENEYRMIIKTDQETFLPLGNAISAIYVYDFDSINTKIVENIVKQRVPIYALSTNSSNGVRQIDRIDLQQYHKAMSGVAPKMPKLELK
jgi:hypothetical protein